MADVTLQISVNSAAVVTGAIVAEIGDTIQLRALSKVGWNNADTRWEIYSYPPSFVAPAGWSTDSDGVIYYLGSADPPVFTITFWGKFLTRVTAANQSADERTVVTVYSPSGLKDVMRREGSQIAGERMQWVGDWQDNLRTMETMVVASGAGVADYAYAASITPSIGAVHSHRVEALTGNLTFNAPNNLTDGAIVAFEVFQDGTGGRTVTWNAAYEMPDGIGYACPVANARTRWVFVVDEPNSALRCLSRVFSIGSVSHTSGSPTLVPGVVNYISGTVTVPVIPAGSLWSGACNALTVKCENPGTIPVVLTRSGSDTLNGATTFNIPVAYGQAVVLSRGTTALLVSPG